MKSFPSLRAMARLAPDLALFAGFALVGYGTYDLFGFGLSAIVIGALLLLIVIGGRIHAARHAAGPARGNE